MFFAYFLIRLFKRAVIYRYFFNFYGVFVIELHYLSLPFTAFIYCNRDNLITSKNTIKYLANGTLKGFLIGN